MAEIGRIEILSSDFAIGWAETTGKEPTLLYALLDEDILGFGAANIKRPDLEKAAAQGKMNAYGFVMLFRQPVPYERVRDVKVMTVKPVTQLPVAAAVRIDRAPKLQIFIFGSPRSGTSELGNTLAVQLKLPWLGEGHAAPLFAAGAKALDGNATDPNGLVRFMAQQNLRQVAIDAAKRAYFFMHASASFIDKTPGISMISAVPFLIESFPDAKFICLRRNGISNVLSRMVKFGGNFDGHCADWAAALNEWDRVRGALPHYLELKQEDMASNPAAVADKLGEYLGVPEMAEAFAQSLSSGSREATGAGRGRDNLSQTGWSEPQIKRFIQLCGPTMEKFGYPLDKTATQ